VVVTGEDGGADVDALSAQRVGELAELERAASEAVEGKAREVGARGRV
jgi:hypothetical protein